MWSIKVVSIKDLKEFSAEGFHYGGFYTFVFDKDHEKSK